MKAGVKYSGVAWIGNIPESWRISKVKDAFVRKNQKAHQENPVVLSLARSGVRVRDISTNEGQVAESYYDYNPVEIDDLLINPMDLYSGANCSISKVSGVISPAYVNLRYKKNVCPRFYDYYFKTQYWAMAFFAHGKGISFDNRWTLGIDTLLNYPIPSPSYVEQKAIADFLDTKCGEIDELVALQEKIIEELKSYKQSVITETVCKGLNPNAPMKDSGVEWIGEIPEVWQVVKLGLLTSKIGSGSTPSGGAEVYTDDGVKFIRSQNVYFEGFNLTDVAHISYEIDEQMKGTRVQNGDILFNITGGSIGRCCDVDATLGEANVNQHVCIVRPTKIKTKYLKYYLQSDNGQIQVKLLQTGGNRDGLSADAFKKFHIVLPSSIEQQEIADYLDKKCSEIDQLISIKQQKIVELKDYKKSLIYEYTTGKKEVSHG